MNPIIISKTRRPARLPQLSSEILHEIITESNSAHEILQHLRLGAIVNVLRHGMPSTWIDKYRTGFNQDTLRFELLSIDREPVETYPLSVVKEIWFLASDRNHLLFCNAHPDSVVGCPGCACYRTWPKYPHP